VSGATTTEGVPPVATAASGDDSVAQLLTEVREIKEILKKR